MKPSILHRVQNDCYELSACSRWLPVYLILVHVVLTAALYPFRAVGHCSADWDRLLHVLAHRLLWIAGGSSLVLCDPPRVFNGFVLYWSCFLCGSNLHDPKLLMSAVPLWV